MKIPEIDIRKFDYLLPEQRIAKYPIEPRDSSKLLVYRDGNIEQSTFTHLAEYLPKDSLLLVNNTRVIPARLFFKKLTGAVIEIFCLEPYQPSDYTLALTAKGSCRWKTLVGNLKKWKAGDIVLALPVGEQTISVYARQLERIDDAVLVEFYWHADVTFSEILNAAGEIPLPPYLNRHSEERDKITYQTTFGKIDGSVAAPTAGLHFTERVFCLLQQKNIHTAEITLHVGAGTFKPVKSNSITEHAMHSETFSVSRQTLEMMLKNYGNITTVGTTTVRTLESLYYIAQQIINQNISYSTRFFVSQWEPYQNRFTLNPEQALQVILEYLDCTKQPILQASTAIIIVPGFDIKYVNRLVTNFHQPRSTLLLLVAAFVGDDWEKMYRYALENDFRFLSYGDGCLILR